MEKPVVIRPLDESEWPIMQHLTIEMSYLEPQAFHVDTDLLHTLTPDQWIENLQTLTTHLTAFIDDEAVGQISAIHINSNSYNYVLLADLYVRAAVRSQGIGRALMQQCFDFATAHEATSVILSVHNDNLHAKRWYERLGFTENDPPYLLHDSLPMTELKKPLP